MFIRLEVACRERYGCKETFVPIERIMDIKPYESKDDATVKSLVRLEDGTEYMCISDFKYYTSVLTRHNLIL